MSLHYATEAVTVFFWNRLSDHVGRKPVLLCCLAGTTVSIISFGLSRSFWMIVFRYVLHPDFDVRFTHSVLLSAAVYMVR